MKMRFRARVTLAVCRCSYCASEIGNNCRFARFRQEEVQERPLRKQRQFGQGRCPPEERHTEGYRLLEGQSDDSAGESLSCVGSRISKYVRGYQLRQPLFAPQSHLSSRCARTPWCRRWCDSLTRTWSALRGPEHVRQPNAWEESNRRCASLHRGEEEAPGDPVVSISFQQCHPLPLLPAFPASEMQQSAAEAS